MGKRSPDTIDIEVGRRIRLQRIARGISQTELGKELGVTFQQVQKYEKGINRVGAGRLSRIAETLGVSVHSLLGGTASEEREPKGNGRLELEYLIVPGALRLVQSYSEISEPELRRAVVELVDRIAAESKLGRN